MAEIPEHLLKRAQAARENAEANQTTSDQTPSETIEADSSVAVIEEEIPETDDRAEEILNQIREGLGETVLTSHLAPGRGLWIRVSSDNWRQTAEFLKDELDCKFFDWLSGKVSRIFSALFLYSNMTFSAYLNPLFSFTK